MTAQIPDTCIFDGQKWEIENWHGDTDCIPNSEQLGIQTVGFNTANYAGRIDHYMVHQKRLHLFKIEGEFADSCKKNFPPGARLEVVLHYEPVEIFDNNGSRSEIREYKVEYFVFDKLVVPFTGDLYLLYPYINDWEQPVTDEDDECEEEEKQRVVLSFKEGLLIDSGCVDELSVRT